MKTLGIALVILFIFIQTASSKEFEDFVVNTFEKERISASHYRFHKNNSSITIHVQAESYDPKSLWRNESLDRDVRLMFEKRQFAYSLLGFSHAQIHSYSFQDRTLTLEGSYQRLSGKKMNFVEKNFYHQNTFLQVKIISTEKIAEDWIQKIIAQINPFALTIDELTRPETDE